MSKMDENPDKYKALRGPMVVLVADYMTPYMSKLDDDLKKIHLKAIGDVKVKPQLDEVMDAAKNLPNSVAELYQILNNLVKLPIAQLAGYIKPIAMAFYRTLDFKCPLPLLEKIINVWIQQETVAPQELYEQTLKFLLSTGDKEIQNVTVTNEYLINEPARILRCDERALKSPKHFECVIRMLEFYLISSQRYQKKIYEKVFYKYNLDQKERL